MDHQLLLLQYYYYYIDFHFDWKWKWKDCLVNPLLHRVTWTQWTQWKWKWSTEHRESIALGVFVVVDVLVVVVLCCVINPWFDSLLIFCFLNMFFLNFLILIHLLNIFSSRFRKWNYLIFCILIFGFVDVYNWESRMIISNQSLLND